MVGRRQMADGGFHQGHGGKEEAGAVDPSRDKRRRGSSGVAARAILAGLLLWFAASSALSHPDYLAYFNVLAAASRSGSWSIPISIGART